MDVSSSLRYLRFLTGGRRPGRWGPRWCQRRCPPSGSRPPAGQWAARAGSWTRRWAVWAASPGAARGWPRGWWPRCAHSALTGCWTRSWRGGQWAGRSPGHLGVTGGRVGWQPRRRWRLPGALPRSAPSWGTFLPIPVGSPVRWRSTVLRCDWPTALWGRRRWRGRSWWRCAYRRRRVRSSTTVCGRRRPRLCSDCALTRPPAPPRGRAGGHAAAGQTPADTGPRSAAPRGCAGVARRPEGTWRGGRSPSAPPSPPSSRCCCHPSCDGGDADSTADRLQPMAGGHFVHGKRRVRVPVKLLWS